MKFVTSITFLVTFVGIGIFAADSPFTRYLPDLRYCKEKVGAMANIDKIVSNVMNGVEAGHIYYCLVACMIKKAKILDKSNWLNMTRIDELTSNVKELQTVEYKDLFERLDKCSRASNNRRDTCFIVESTIKCAIPVDHAF